MADEGTEYVVVVQGPVHDSVVVIALRGSKDALIVVGEFNEIHAVSLGVVCVDLVPRFKVVERN